MGYAQTLRSTKLLVPLVAVMALLMAGCELAQPPGSGWMVNPVGYVDTVSGGTGEVHVTGWSAEWVRYTDDGRLVPDPTRVAVLVDGIWAQGLFTADQPRPDVDQYFVDQGLWDYRRTGAPYGFDITVPAPAGRVSVCVSAVNQWLLEPVPGVVPVGDHVLLGCQTVTVR